MNRIGMYAASFDPITIWHMDIIARAATLFDILVVVVGQNPKKVGSYTFNIRQRTEMVQSACNHRSIESDWRGRGIVEAVANESSLTAKFADNWGRMTYGIPVKAFVRGIRNAEDFQKELNEYYTTLEIAPGIEFVPLFCKQTLAHISSSMVKGLTAYDGWENEVRRYLPLPVQSEFIAKFQQSVEAK